MKLNIKWLTVGVENEDEALSIIEHIESKLKEDGYYYKWDYEIEDD